MPKEEYKEKVWEILRGYSFALDIEDLEVLLEEIMAVPFPKEGTPKV